MRILAIETSADETAIALLEADGATPEDARFKVLGNALLSQITHHIPYGGIYPNIAKREHGRNLVPVLMEALLKAGELNQVVVHPDDAISKEVGAILEREAELHTYLSEFFRSHGKPAIETIAVTYGPGLEPALWVGINFAKALSRVWHVPIVPVNHMEGHLMMAAAREGVFAPVAFPAIALLVSGGHTELVLIREWMKYELLGETRDDAAGECFDKCARLLGLPYPGGPEIATLAQKARASGLPRATPLPRPMHDSKDFDFSFSGLKTAVRNAVHLTTQGGEKTFSHEDRAAFAREIEDAIVEVLVKKTAAAAEEYGAHTVILGGGVSANEHLRADLTKKLEGTPVLFPPAGLSTDNAIMIALAGYFRAQKKEFAPHDSIKASGNLRLI